MKRTWVVAALLCALGILAGAAGCSTRGAGEAEETRAVSSADTVDAAATPWLIAPSLLTMEQTVAATCSGADPTVPIAASNAEIEQALTGTGDAGTQPIGAMTRRLFGSAVCNTQVGSPHNAASIAVGHDAIDIVSGSADGCSLAYSGPATSDAGGKTISTSAGPYTIAPGDWKDVLRVLYAGVDHNGNKDCNSPIRHALVSNWNNLFETSCGSGCPSGLRHVFRPSDKSDTLDWFLLYLGLPPASSNPFCNGVGATISGLGDADSLDNDPIRIPCSGAGTTAADVDHVCNAAPAAGAGDAGGQILGDLGLVLPVAVPQLPDGVDPASVLYPGVGCDPGSFGLVSQPAGVPCVVAGPSGQCVAPYAGSNNYACHNDVSNIPPGTNLDGRAFNLQVRLPDGTLATDRSGRPLVGAFYRLRAGITSGVGDGTGSWVPGPTQCRALTSDDEGWCLSRAVSCSLAGVARSAGVRALAYPASEPGGLLVKGVAPTQSNVQQFFYPLTYTVWINTVVGFANVPHAMERLGVCWGRKSLAESAGLQGGIVPMVNGPTCTDFGESGCDAGITNVNACADDAGRPLNFAQPQCTIDVGKEVFITDPAVVDDPLRTRFTADAGTPGRGALTIKTLLENMAPSPDQAPAMMRDLMTQIETAVPDTFPGAAGGQPSLALDVSALMNRWPTLDGTDGGPLDLEKAPFRLLAIVNRVDQANLSGVGPAGEGRFIFAFTDNDAGTFDDSGAPLTFILEYTLPSSTLGQWAQAWHAVGSLDDAGTYGPEYLAGLQQLTAGFTSPGALAGAPNGSALASLRTRDQFSMRQFGLVDQQASFAELRVANTPYDDLEAVPADDGQFHAFVEDNQAAILASNFVLPDEVLDWYTEPRNAVVRTDDPVVPNEVRHMLSLNTCFGCHLGETPANQFQVQTRAPGVASVLSPFLTGQARFQVAGDLQVLLPASSAPLRHFNDLERRASVMRDLVCP